MLFKMIFYLVVLYIVFKIIRIIGRLFTISSQMQKMNNAGNGNKKKVYSKEDIEEADYEEIK
jgi:hypothetical protein